MRRGRNVLVRSALVLVLGMHAEGPCSCDSPAYLCRGECVEPVDRPCPELHSLGKQRQHVPCMHESDRSPLLPLCLPY